MLLLPCPTRALATCLAIASVGCQRENPAFDLDGAADGGSEGDDASTTQTTQTSMSQSSTGDGDGEGDGDGDGEGDGDSDPDAGIPDMMVETCEIDVFPGLWPRFGDPDQFLNQTCPPGFTGHVRVWDMNGTHWMAGHCPLGCGSPCDTQIKWVIGADGIDDVGLATLFPPFQFNPNMPWVGCYYVDVSGNLPKEGADACYYSSLSVFGNEGPESPLLFNANRQSAGLSPAAAVLYGSWTPEIVDQMVPTCECGDLGIECCPNTTVVAKHFMLGEPVFPPNGTTGLVLNQSPFMFYGAQAQSGTICGLDPETSWAIWASP